MLQLLVTKDYRFVCHSDLYDIPGLKYNHVKLVPRCNNSSYVLTYTFLDPLVKVRNDVDAYHDMWYSDAIELAKKVDVQETRPRVIGRQTHRDNPRCDSPTEYFKTTITIPFLDHLLTEMNERFVFSVQ